MTIAKLASAIAKREGKKSQARIGDIREILKVLVTLLAEEAIKDPHGCQQPLIDAFNKYADQTYERMKKRKARK